jgi:oligopeptidase B
MSPKPPVAAKKPTTHRCHGHERVDPFAWLRDPSWREVMRDPGRLDPEIRAYLEAENAHTAAVLAPLTALRTSLYDELRGRIKEDDASVPQPHGPFVYYSRFRQGGQYPVFARRPARADEDAEEILFDGDREAEGLPYFRLAACEHSPDHRRLAFAVDTNGSEIYTIGAIDLQTGRRLPDRLGGAHGSVAWAGDSATLYYTVLDDEHRPRWVYRHRLGDDPKRDVLVYEEPDPGFFMSVNRTESGRFVVISAHDHTTSEVRFIDAHDPEGDAVLVAGRERGVEYELTDHGDRWLIRTNAGGAPDYKIVEAPLDRPGRAHWRDLVAHEPGRLIHGLRSFRDFIVRLERRDALPRIVIRRAEGGDEHVIAFDEEAYELGLVPGYEYATDTLRFTYASLATPPRVYDYDMRTRDRVLRKEQEIPSGHEPAAYEVKRLLAPAPDGEQVPISLLRRKDSPKDASLDGSAPLLLYGYGSYGMISPAGFSANRFSLVDRGFSFAIAHVRGGRERGQRWYEGGKLEHKQNTFHDFIACAEHLIERGYTSAGKLAMHGGSAGGLLVGAVLNLRPELFRAAVANVPFVDVLTTMCDRELPLTPPEWPEWGNPIEDAGAYRTILSYSPYDNVEARTYPHLLVTAGLTDPRVTYWEPAKWVARLREAWRGDALLLLKTEMSAGHGGPSGRFSYLDEVALSYAFLLRAFGLEDL